MFYTKDKPMFSKEETRIVLGVLVPLLVAHVILYLCGYQDGSAGAPVNKWIVLLIFVGNMFFYWKNKIALLKRFILALPFALLTVLLLSWFGVAAISDPSSWPWVFGVLMFVVLTAGKENLKQFFVVRLAIGTVLIGLLAILVTLINSARLAP